MANWQALTFGGWAPFETQGESQMSFAWNGKDLRRNIRYQKRMIRFNNEQSKAMSLWSAKEMPSATMLGLKRAGLNPLLTAGGSTNVAPMVASSAASVPYSESYDNSGTVGQSGDINGVIDLFSGTSSLERKARKSSALATEEQNKANRAEQEARRKFFESDEGRKAVRDRLRMEYGPQSAMQAAVLGAHTASDAANAISDAHDVPTSEPTTNQWLAWWRDDKRGTSVRDINKNRRRSWSRRDSHNKVDRSRHNVFNFNFGSSAKGVKSDRPPVWTNPDLTPYRP